MPANRRPAMPASPTMTALAQALRGAARSMIAFLPDFPAEYPVGPAGVAEDNRNDHDCPDQHEKLAPFRRRGLPDGDAVGDHIGPHANAQPDHAEQENTQRDQERAIPPPLPEAPPQREEENPDKKRHLRREQDVRHVEPALPILLVQERRIEADGD